MRAIVFKGALDASLKEIQAGRQVCPLLLGHDHAKTLIHDLERVDERSFSLRISKAGDRVLFRLNADTRSGRFAAAVIRANAARWRGLSLNISVKESVRLPDCPDMLGITLGEVRDCSIVAQPRCPGCRITTI
jgi:hypothetical protein